MKEAERRQTLGSNRRILRCGARPFGARTLDGVPPRLSPARGHRPRSHDAVCLRAMSFNERGWYRNCNGDICQGKSDSRRLYGAKRPTRRIGRPSARPRAIHIRFVPESGQSVAAQYLSLCAISDILPRKKTASDVSTSAAMTVKRLFCTNWFMCSSQTAIAFSQKVSPCTYRTLLAAIRRFRILASRCTGTYVSSCWKRRRPLPARTR
jgi:hypothetical protein